jgi:hypothetical protein
MQVGGTATEDRLKQQHSKNLLSPVIPAKGILAIPTTYQTTFYL